MWKHLSGCVSPGLDRVGMRMSLNKNLHSFRLQCVFWRQELKDQGHGDQSHCRDAGWRDILHPGPDTIATMAMEGVTGPEARPRWVVAGQCMGPVLAFRHFVKGFLTKKALLSNLTF